MFENFRRSLKGRKNQESKFKFKTVVAYVIFGAIILVFALFGITPERMGTDLGGNAAVVDGNAISIASFQRRLDLVQRNSGLNMDQFPAAQRELFARELRRRTLEEMVMIEGLYQRAQKLGLRVSDEELRRAITSIPIFQEEGRFRRSLYGNFLQGTGQTSAQFEREIRKELMTQKLRTLFLASNQVSVEVQDGLKSLDQVSLGFRYASFDPANLSDNLKVSTEQVKQALSSQLDQVKEEYEKRKIDYFSPAKVRAQHILIKIDTNQNQEQAEQKLKELQAEVTVENFDVMAKKYSDDPGSKAKGGDLGFFERGRMVPAFEEVAFSLEPGKISEPVKTDFGYHLILVNEKDQGGQKDFEEVKEDVARKYLASQIVSEKVAALKKAVEAGDITEVNKLMNDLNVEWKKIEKATLASVNLPELPQAEEAMRLLASRRGELGLIPEVKNWSGESYLFDLTQWSSKPASSEKSPTEPVTNNSTERLASEAFQNWIVSLNETLKVERNARLLQ